tara:strand:+ start:166 stop:654 length:489 start_codon:yes stop_codon:yes gene_type:complete
MDARLEHSQPIDGSFEFQPFIARIGDDRQPFESGQLFIFSTSEDVDHIIERESLLPLFLYSTSCEESNSDNAEYIADWVQAYLNRGVSVPGSIQTQDWQASPEWVGSQLPHALDSNRFYYVAAIPQYAMVDHLASGNACAFFHASEMWGRGLRSNIFRWLND